MRRSVEQLADPRTAPEARRGAAMALGVLPGIRLQTAVQDVLTALAATATLQVGDPPTMHPCRNWAAKRTCLFAFQLCFRR